MKVHELLDEMDWCRQKLAVYSMLEDMLSEYVSLDTDDSPRQFLVSPGSLSGSSIPEDVFVEVMCQITTLKIEAEDDLRYLEDMEVDDGEEDQEEEYEEEEEEYE